MDKHPDFTPRRESKGGFTTDAQSKRFFPEEVPEDTSPTTRMFITKPIVHNTWTDF